jgi:virulence-associated protein VagC
MALRAQHRAVKVKDEDYQLILNPQKDEWEQWKMDDATEGVGT